MCNIKHIPLYSNINRLNPCHPSLSNIMRQGGSKTEHTEQRPRNCQNKTGLGGKTHGNIADWGDTKEMQKMDTGDKQT